MRYNFELLKRSLSPNVPDLFKLPSSSIQQNKSQTPSTSIHIPTINQTKPGYNSSKYAFAPTDKHKRENVTVQNNTMRKILTTGNVKLQLPAVSDTRIFFKALTALDNL